MARAIPRSDNWNIDGDCFSCGKNTNAFNNLNIRVRAVELLSIVGAARCGSA